MCGRGPRGRKWSWSFRRPDYTDCSRLSSPQYVPRPPSLSSPLPGSQVLGSSFIIGWVIRAALGPTQRTGSTRHSPASRIASVDSMRHRPRGAEACSCPSVPSGGTKVKATPARSRQQLSAPSASTRTQHPHPSAPIRTHPHPSAPLITKPISARRTDHHPIHQLVCAGAMIITPILSMIVHTH